MDAVKDRAAQTEQVDASLDKIQRARELVMLRPSSAKRSLLLAELADAEAGRWEALSEHSRIRVHWRAAQVAREHARLTARTWRHRAARQRASELATPATPTGVA